MRSPSLARSDTYLPEARTELDLILPTTKLVPGGNISGNRYDIALACNPEDTRYYPLYDTLVDFVEKEHNLRMYSPHADVQRGRKASEACFFAIKEAIPRARGVLVHAAAVATSELKEMVRVMQEQSKPFVLFSSYELSPIELHSTLFTQRELRESDPRCKGSISYWKNEEAIRKVSNLIPLLT